ncbi:beta-lactamase family protein [Marivirga sp. S37H4]|uniref:Beta-lactamase family protein n=1 Tax=Marivirga aurantiaca TaxID=2802615 RepID=A0A935C8K4_9BACT|nr:serine hydrolase domain-containing protein [Marivirga aurantiaca]MBK6265661.1 beta-lactamase family protein [Marivirga aurantiaca]
MQNILLICSFLLCAFSLTAQSINKQKLDSLFVLLENNEQTMGSIHISREGKSIYSRSIGYSSVEDNSEADQNTRYRIGSITKIYTATLIFQLIEEGKMDLDTPLENFFPEIPNANKISIGSLLNHSSGIYNITKSEGFDPQAVKTHEELVKTIAAFEPVFEPDTKSEYSNSNYILLGYIIEEIEQKPYAEVLKERITDKLELKSTYYGGSIDTTKNEAYSYHFNEGWEKSSETNMDLPHGAGAIVSTPAELTTFITALFNKQLISEESLSKMTKQRHGMGFGIGGTNQGGKQMYGHDGGIDGFSSLLIYVPEDQLAIAFMANGNQYPLMAIVRSALMASNDMPFDLPSFEVFELNEDDLEKYTGIYACSEIPLKLTFTQEDGQLLGAPTGQEPAILKPIKEHQFQLVQAGVTISFNLVDNSLQFTQGGKELLFKKEE